MATSYNIKEIKHEGLLYEWEINVPAAPIVTKLQENLEEERKTFKMAGYRDGKVPADMVRKQQGPKILASIIEAEVDEVLKEVLKEKNVKPALQPIVEIKSFDDKTNLVFTAKIEYLPEIPTIQWDKITIVTHKVKPSKEDLDKALSEIKDKFKTFKEASKNHAAKKGDAVIIDFHGTVSGKDFEGNKADGIRLELGSNQFIPGFEDQLIGASAGMKLKVRVSFPKNYTNKDLAGKPAVFEVTIHQVLTPEDVSDIDDAFAAKLGLDSVAKLIELIEEKISADFNGLARLSMKKKLFDAIDAMFFAEGNDRNSDSKSTFDVPDGMIKIDFDTMWNEIKSQKQSNPEMFRGKSETEMMKEYKEIAKRRVRLGILLADIARDNNIEVSETDLQQAVFAEAMQRPGQEKIVTDFYAKPENLDRLKGPILEEKAVDHILGLIKRDEVEISSKEFFDKYAEELNALGKNPAAPAA